MHRTTERKALSSMRRVLLPVSLSTACWQTMVSCAQCYPSSRRCSTSTTPKTPPKTEEEPVVADPFASLLAQLSEVNTKGKKRSHRGGLHENTVASLSSSSVKPPPSPSVSHHQVQSMHGGSPINDKQQQQQHIANVTSQTSHVNSSSSPAAPPVAESVVEPTSSSSATSTPTNSPTHTKEAEPIVTAATPARSISPSRDPSSRLQRLLDEENERHLQRSASSSGKQQKMVSPPPPGTGPTAPASSSPSDISSTPSTAATTTTSPPLSPPLPMDIASAIPVPSARLPLTTSEMVQEGAPQHFVAEVPSSSMIHRPLLSACGHVALVDLIGRVQHPPCLMKDEVGSNGDFAWMVLEYQIPFGNPPAVMEVEARAYGASLSQFVMEMVREGDTVHINGHLLPTTSTGKVAVVALEQGGNVSIVLGKR